MIILLLLLLSIAEQFGIDLVHFGLIIVSGLLIGMVTPPMGVGLYLMVEVAQISFEEIVVAVLPFLIPLLVVFFLITFVPALTTFLPNFLMGVL